MNRAFDFIFKHLRSSRLDPIILIWGWKLSVFEREQNLVKFYHNLHLNMSVGRSLYDALDVEARETQSEVLKTSLRYIQTELEKGHSFSEVLELLPEVFPQTHQKLISITDRIGLTQEALPLLEGFQQIRSSAMKYLLKAFTYPVLLVVAAIGMFYFLTQFILPKIAKELPPKALENGAPTLRYAVYISDFVFSADALALIFFGAAIGFFLYLRFEKVRYYVALIISEGTIRVPYLEEIICDLEFIKIVKLLILVQRNGLSFYEGLVLAPDLISNVAVRRSIREVCYDIIRGRSLFVHLCRSKYAPHLLRDNIETAVGTGKFTEVMTDISRVLAAETLVKIEKFQQGLAKAVMFMVGASIVVLGLLYFQIMTLRNQSY